VVIGLILIELVEVVMKKKMMMVMLKMMEEEEMKIYGMFEVVVVVVGMATKVGVCRGRLAASWMVADGVRRKVVTEIERGSEMGEILERS